jgi:hypothetical protein
MYLLQKPKNNGYFCNFQVTAQSEQSPLGENSPNPVTLLGCIVRQVFKASSCGWLSRRQSKTSLTKLLYIRRRHQGCQLAYFQNKKSKFGMLVFL